MAVTDAPTIKSETRQAPLSLAAAGTTAPTPAGAGNGVRFPNNGRRYVRVRNTTGAPVTGTVLFGTTVDGQAVTGLPFTCAATTGDVELGPFPSSYNDSASRVTFELSAGGAGVSYDIIERG